ncbi:MAG TPA: hypothetical protein DCM61_04030 [Clostridiales bacterium]|nr:hypothetical protein [Clostridiales bacterium]
MLRLTKRNYYSEEANREYWSASFVKAMLRCPAAAMAMEPEEPSTALLVGSYVDAYFEGTLDRFRAEHPELFKRDGTLKSDYLQAEEMIERARSDKVFMEFMRGRKQVIKTGTIGGLPFKIKMDVYKKGKRIVDLKTTRNTEPVYKPGEGWVTFADAWEWPLQLAIYQTIEGNRLPCFLAVITKENPADLAVIEVSQERLDAEMQRLLDKLPYLDAIKSGIIEPPRCGRCAYCRRTKKLTGPVSLAEYEKE